MGKVLDTIWQSKNLRSDRVKALLEVFESVGGLSSWAPARHEWMRVLFWSFIPEKTYQQPSLSELVSEFAASIIRCSKPTSDSLSELSGAALLISLGCQVSKLERSHERSPDFEVEHGARVFHFEVTRPEPKSDQVVLHEYGSKLSRELSNRDRGHDVVIMLASVLDSAEDRDLKEAVTYLESGQTLEKQDFWKIVAEPISASPPNGIQLRRFDDLPSWWPARFEQTPIRITGSYTIGGGPRTIVACATRVKGYLNALKRKAGHFQGAPSSSLFVGFDTENLKGCFAELSEELPKKFSKWRHIAGVLAFEAHTEPTKIGWKLQSFKNPSAVSPSPLVLPDAPRLLTENPFGISE
mgnify:FL=1